MYALTIAGGKGERLKPLTDNIPKPMVEINGKPLIHHQADILMANGVTDIIFLCGYKGEVIRDYFGDGSKYGFRAQYTFEETPLGRGGALKLGFELVPATEEFVYGLNGDTLFAEPLANLVELHKRKNAIATDMLVPYVSSYGIVEVEDDMVARFSEKIVLPHWINSGVYVLSREIADMLPACGDHEDSTFPELARQGRLAALKSDKAWRAVDNFKELKDASQKLTDGLFPSGR